jgi:hypothetical protein
MKIEKVPGTTLKAFDMLILLKTMTTKKLRNRQFFEHSILNYLKK